MQASLTMTQIIRAHNRVAPRKVSKFKSREAGMAKLNAELKKAGKSLDDVVHQRDYVSSGYLGKKIRLLVKENPKRPGSATHKRYGLYAVCKTSDEFLEKSLEGGMGSRREVLSDLAWDSQHGYIRLT